MTYNANYPVSADVLANPTNLTNRDDPGFELHGVISRIQDILEALEAKVGIGSSTPGAAGAVLRRTASGASAWGGLVDADVAAVGTANISVGKLVASGAGNEVVATGGAAPAAWQKVATAMIAAGAVSQFGSATGSGATNSGSLVPITGASVSLTTNGGIVVFFVTGAATCNTAGGITQYSLAMDGGVQGGLQSIAALSAGAYHGFSLIAAAQPSAGSHSFSAMWSTISGVATTLSNCTIYAVEIKR
jgi:hypothetical protein